MRQSGYMLATCAGKVEINNDAADKLIASGDSDAALLYIYILRNGGSAEPEKAALYYENLLLYDAEYPVAYGEYGMFLIRTGQKEASRKLWEDYKEKEKAELLDDSESRNLQLWEEINEKKKRK